MTNVCLEHLCEHCGVVRVGANAPFPAPYLYSVTFVIRGAYAEPVGFDHRRITPSEFKAIISSINQATGKLVAYDRAGVPPSRVVQINPGLTKGKIAMTIDRSHLSKTHVPSPAHAQHRDGSIDESVLQTDGAKAFKLFNDKEETMLNVERVVLADGSVIDMFHHIRTDALKK